jgi:hypothetical protein
METIEALNTRLEEYYGMDTASRKPIFRIVWSEDQTENRLTDTLDSGIQLLFPVIRLCRKYNYIRDRYVLERLVVVPEEQQKELAGLKVSYEPLFTYEREDGTPLPPIWAGTKFIIDAVYAALGKKSLRKYVEDLSPEAAEAQLKTLENELFGDESGLYGKTTPGVGEGIVVPSTYGEH